MLHFSKQSIKKSNEFEFSIIERASVCIVDSQYLERAENEIVNPKIWILQGGRQNCKNDVICNRSGLVGDFTV